MDKTARFLVILLIAAALLIVIGRAIMIISLYDPHNTWLSPHHRSGLWNIF